MYYESNECYDKAQLLWTCFKEEAPKRSLTSLERNWGRKREASMMTKQTLFKRIGHGAQVQLNSFIEEYIVGHTQTFSCLKLL